MKKNQKASPFRWMLRRYIFLMVVMLVVSFAVFPMQGMMRVMSVSSNLRFLQSEGPVSVSAKTTFTRALTLEFVYSPLNLEMLCLLFGGLGFGAALVLFRHLFSRKQGMMIAGLPMTRSRGFLMRCGVYAIWCLAPLALCLAVHPLVVWGNGLSEYLNLGVYLGRAGAAMLINLYGFALGALCSSLFGTFWSAGLGGLMIAGSVEFVMYCWIWIASRYLGTLYLAGAEKDMLSLSPVYSLYKSFYRPDLFSPVRGMILTAAMLGLGWAAYRAARPEHAGHTLNWKPLEPVILVWSTVLGGTAGALVMTMYLGWEIILYLGLLLGAAVVWLLAGMLMDQRIGVRLQKWKLPAAALAVMLAALLGLRGDWTGFNRYAPESSRLSAIRFRPDMFGQDFTFTDTESMDACLTWVGQMREEALEARREHPYQSVYGNALMFFEEKGGKTVVRQYCYPEDQAAALPALRVLAEHTERQRAEQIRPLSGVRCYSALSSYGIYSEEFREIFGFSPDSISMPRLDPREAAEALRQDMQAHTLDSLQAPGILSFYFEGVNPETGEYEYDANGSYTIRAGDTHSLALALGKDAEKWVDYAEGGFFRSGQVRVFLCEYSPEEDELISYRMAETEEEVRDWMSRACRCTDVKYSLPTDRTRQVKIYSLPSLRNMMDYGELELDPEDPEAQKKLPELTETGAMTYYLTADI